jgi:hypothetical protein
MINRLVESKYKEGKVIRTFASFGKYLTESAFDGYVPQKIDYDPAEVKSRINRAILWLSINRGFYGELLTHLNIYGSSSVSTMCTDGTSIIFGPQFVLDHTREELCFVLCHEILHCIGYHHERRVDRDPYLWNVAADLAINPILMDDPDMKIPVVKSGVHAGKINGLYEEKFVGMRAEEIYDIVSKDPKWTGEDIKKAVENTGEVLDSDAELPEADDDLVVQEVEGDEYEDSDDDWDDGDDDWSDEDDDDDWDDGDDDWSDEEDEDEWDEKEWDDTNDDFNDDEEKGDQGGDSEDSEDNEELEEPKVGDYVKLRGNKYGKISSINPDGTMNIQELSKEEVKQALKDQEAGL